MASGFYSLLVIMYLHFLYIRCSHHYHRSCVTDWFRLNRKCPLCKQDFRGKEYDEYSEDGDEEESSSRHGNEFQMDQINASR